MKILAVEFSSPQRSVAVSRGRDERATIVEAVETSARGSGIIGLIEDALRQAQVEREQIECLAIGLGPGSYTGIRSSIALAQGWELSSGERGIKVIGLSSAECIAAQARSDGLTGVIAVVIDAQRNEFYLSSYKVASDLQTGLEPLRLASFAEVQARERAGELLVGPEVQRWFPAGRAIFPRAATLAQLALRQTEFISAETLQPIYLRETTFVKAPPPRKLPF